MWTLLAVLGMQIASAARLGAQELQNPSDIDSVRSAVKKAEELYKEKNFKKIK